MSPVIKLGNKGFNLLEVAIAGFIFATVSIAFLGVWGMQVRGVEKSRHSLVAGMLAEGLLEEAMEQGYGRVDEIEPGDDDIEMITESRDASGNWAEISVNYSTRLWTADIGGEDDRLESVTVEVSWDDSSGGGQITLVTYLAGER